MSTSQRTVGWNGVTWVHTSELHLGMQDLGALQGAVAVDRLRTVAGKLLDCDEHLVRFRQSCEVLGIADAAQTFDKALLQELVKRNVAHFGDADFSVIVLATPGVAAGVFTRFVYPMAIHWAMLDSFYRLGQALHVAKHRAVPAECWSPQLKTRNRLQYYLADNEARGLFGPQAAGVLLSTAGFVSETSTANLLLVESGKLVSPRLEGILHGVSLARTLRLAKTAGIEVVFEDVTPQRAAAADEILLCGTTGCLWTASKIDEKSFASPEDSPVYQQLAKLWSDDVGLDFREQAKQLSSLEG